MSATKRCGEDIVRKVRCIDNTHFENLVTVGKEYISSCDFLWDSYIIEDADNGGTKQVVDRKLFKVI